MILVWTLGLLVKRGFASKNGLALLTWSQHLCKILIQLTTCPEEAEANEALDQMISHSERHPEPILK